MSISQNLRQIRSTLQPSVKLVAVSKFHPASALQEAYDAGQRVFGESRAQELTAKQEALPLPDIEWHFIGPLQSNKVKQIAPFIHLIESVDSVKLLDEIQKQAVKNGRTIHVLLEIHIAEEESKQGFSPEECLAFLQSDYAAQYPNIRIAGLMGMATLTDNAAMIRREFHGLKELHDRIRREFITDGSFTELSMGMSHDYTIAMEEGSTMVRIGSAIFGEREY